MDMTNSVKYAGVIDEIVRKGQVLTVANKVFAVSDEGEPYAHVISQKSVYYLSGMKKEGENTYRCSANIPIKDLELIKTYTNFAEKEIFKYKNSPKNTVSDGYTLPFKTGKFAGMTAIDVLNKEGKEVLLNQRKFLDDNKDRYAINNKYISGIDDVLHDFENGCLNNSSQSSNIVIYDTPTKYFKTQNDAGAYKIYKLKISCIPSESSPYQIEISNCYAKLLQGANGTTPIDLKNATDKQKITFSITEGEWLNMLSNMTRNLTEYRQSIYANMHKMDMERRNY